MMLSPVHHSYSTAAATPPAVLPPSARRQLASFFLHVPCTAAAPPIQHVHFDPAQMMLNPPSRDNMMQAPAMMTTGGTWMAYTDRHGRPCW